MLCPTCGAHCTCANRDSAPVALLDGEVHLSAVNEQPDLALGDVWRQEVASRVDAFCARRGRKRMSRIPSLSLDFERAARATAAAHYAVPEPQVDPPAELLVPIPYETPETSNVIEFPRITEAAAVPQLEPVPYLDQLAEPVIEKPRILDAEEPSGLLFGGQPRPAITLEAPPEPDAEQDVVPVAQGASLSRRIIAAAVDVCVIAIAVALFVTVFLHMAGTVPRTRAALVPATVLIVLLWAMYQYLFLVHAAATPGMRMAGLHVRTFDNLPVCRALRRWRAIAMVISGTALGLGFFWSLVDDRGLCWHDRITRTVLRHG